MPRIKATIPRRSPKQKAPKEAPRVRETAPDLPASIDVFVLVDRSGSMANKWTEALSSINAYVQGLKNANVEGGVTVALFDEHAGFRFDVIRNTSIRSYTDISTWEAYPRGGTPLYDAIGKIIELASKTRPQRAAIVIWTDGQENASRHSSRESTRNLLNTVREFSGWQVLFLGADFDAIPQADWLGIAQQNVLNMSAGHYGASTSSLIGSTQSYATRGVNMAFSDSDKLRAQGRAA